jgi:hypothetical protein
MTYTRPANWDKPGHVKRGDEDEAILDQIDSLTAPGWTAFTPSWDNTSTSPSIGNGSWSGSRYRRSESGDIVFFDIVLTWGSTTSGGTGSFWSFGFPFTPSDSAFQGLAWLEDVSAGARRFWQLFNFADKILVTDQTSTFAHSTSPWTWATGDFMKLRGWFVPA